MNKNAKLWMLPLAGSLAFAATGHAEETTPTLERANLDATNRLTLSLRFGLNITGKFTGIGGSFNPGATAGSGHYADGYVLTDVSGNFGGQSWYWGYQNASQVNASGPNSVDFHNYSAPGLANESSEKNPYVGLEVTYDYQIGVKEDWHHLAYGFEAAANYMPISFSTSSSFNGAISQQTDTYGYTAGTTPPGAPYSGSYEGPGFLINVPRTGTTTAVIPGATIETHQNLNANLWGFRLGPYLESPLTEKLSLHASGGFALGLLDANASWDETLTLPGSSLRSSGGGSNFEVLCGFYAGVDAVYHFDERWGVDVGAQFQNLGTYDHNFGGCSASLDLSKSIFIQAGLSYSF
jgi:hypothetical protein